jgi:hypothetical protein
MNYVVFTMYTIFTSTTYYNLRPISSKTESVKTFLKHISPELSNIYLSRDTKLISELYGQRLYILYTSTEPITHILLQWTSRRV